MSLIADTDNSYDVFRRLVGGDGTIDVVRTQVADIDVDVWIADSFLFEPHHMLNLHGSFFSGRPILGPVVLARVDDNGDTIGFTGSQVDAIVQKIATLPRPHMQPPGSATELTVLLETSDDAASRREQLVDSFSDTNPLSSIGVLYPSGVFADASEAVVKLPVLHTERAADAPTLALPLFSTVDTAALPVLPTIHISYRANGGDPGFTISRVTYANVAGPDLSNWQTFPTTDITPLTHLTMGGVWFGDGIRNLWQFIADAYPIVSTEQPDTNWETFDSAVRSLIATAEHGAATTMTSVTSWPVD